MEDPSQNVPPPEKDSMDKVRARLRAAGLYQNLDPPEPGRQVKIRPRDDVVVPFRRPAAVEKKKTERTRKVASAIYLLLLAAGIFLVWH
jgi:hypothetical protein